MTRTRSKNTTVFLLALIRVMWPRYAALIRAKSPKNWNSQLTKSLFQTRSRVFLNVKDG